MREEYIVQPQRSRERPAGCGPNNGGGGSHTGAARVQPVGSRQRSLQAGLRRGWESLRKDSDRAIERYEAAVSQRLAGTLGDARFSAGGSERVPDDYRLVISKDSESLAKVKK